MVEGFLNRQLPAVVWTVPRKMLDSTTVASD